MACSTRSNGIKCRVSLKLEQKDLTKILGSKSRASEILSGKRSLSLRQIKILYRKLGIPVEILIQKAEPVSRLIKFFSELGNIRFIVCESKLLLCSPLITYHELKIINYGRQVKRERKISTESEQKRYSPAG